MFHNQNSSLQTFCEIGDLNYFAKSQENLCEVYFFKYGSSLGPCHFL